MVLIPMQVTEITQDKNRKQALGIFYTRPEIVDFMYDILLVWKNKEDRETGRWNSHKPMHYPSVIDPACGEGIFLKKAIERNFTKQDWVFGMDINEEVVTKWPFISLLEAFDNDEAKVEAIVSLPRDAFKHVGTTAKTSILFLKKQKMDNHNYPVFLASLNKMEADGLKQISEQYKEFYYEGTLKSI